jgi:hypothetical protein
MTASTRIAFTLAFALSLAQCAPKAAAPTSAPPSSAASAASYAYDIKLSFSSDAAARMKELGQKITVMNAFYGDVTLTAKAKADRGGQLDMGSENIDLDAVDQTLHITAKSLKLAGLPDIVDHKPSVLINIASGPSGANQLSCGLFQDQIAVAQTKPVDIQCEAIPADLVGKN